MSFCNANLKELAEAKRSMRKTLKKEKKVFCPIVGFETEPCVGNGYDFKCLHQNECQKKKEK